MAEMPRSQISAVARGWITPLFLATSYPTFELDKALDDILEHYPGMASRMDTVTLMGILCRRKPRV